MLEPCLLLVLLLCVCRLTLYTSGLLLHGACRQACGMPAQVCLRAGTLTATCQSVKHHQALAETHLLQQPFQATQGQGSCSQPV